MKKIISAVLCVFICFSIAACGSAITEKPSGSEVEKQEKEDSVREIKNGEKIVTESMELAINDVTITYDVLPDNTDGFYTHYAADSGKVYINVDADVTNKAKQGLKCDKIGKVVADYNGGYTYKGFVVVEDSSTGFTYANITTVDPLETKGIRFLIECPQEVEESDAPLFLEFTVNSEKFIYTVR